MANYDLSSWQKYMVAPCFFSPSFFYIFTCTYLYELNHCPRQFGHSLSRSRIWIWNLKSCTIFLHKFVIWTSVFDDLMDIEITFSYLKSSVLTGVQWMITTSSWRATIRGHDSHNTDDIWNQALQSLTCQRLLVSNEQVPSEIIPSHKNAADKISLALKDMSN